MRVQRSTIEFILKSPTVHEKISYKTYRTYLKFQYNSIFQFDQDRTRTIKIKQIISNITSKYVKYHIANILFFQAKSNVLSNRIP